MHLPVEADAVKTFGPVNLERTPRVMQAVFDHQGLRTRLAAREDSLFIKDPFCPYATRKPRPDRSLQDSVSASVCPPGRSAGRRPWSRLAGRAPFDAAVNGCRLPEVAPQAYKDHRCQLPHDGGGIVGRAVVDDNNFIIIPSFSQTSTTSACSRAMHSASLKAGITTETYGCCLVKIYTFSPECYLSCFV